MPPRLPAEGRSADAESIGAVIGEALRQPALARGVVVGRLAAGWRDVVGERLAAETMPVRFASGTLVVAASGGPWGAQARFFAEEIRRRATALLGAEVLSRVVVTLGQGDG